MTTGSGTDFRSRLYEGYSSTHAGYSDTAAARLVYRSHIRRALPEPARTTTVLDLGCGQGALVELLQGDGFDASGIDLSAEQVQIARAAGRTGIVLGDFEEYLAGTAEPYDAIVATDLLEHLGKQAVMRTFDQVHHGLKPGGVFVGQVPNAVSPFAGNIAYGDFTHETLFTGRSITQLAATAGFGRVRVRSCPPRVHSARSAARVLVWKPLSGLFKLALAAETGQLRGHIVTQNLIFVAHKGIRG
ncbi:MAG: hypothetical protein QOI35_2710 [Cryptosporangiaceae bacterium]|jgi:predicted TPR repeat methyltransferase|nr:hypothetical protein [Cryptosporangiaceae bacterium]MDQ1657307.1 hypothetical protein [Cryptosporangiaceae bacterium]